MRTFLILFSILFSVPTSAQNGKTLYEPKFKSSLPANPSGPQVSEVLPSECRYWNDSVVVVEFSDWGMYPSSVYVKEGDRVCFIARSVSSRGVTFRVEDHPVGGSVKGETDRGFTFIARKVGSHKISCIGTCNSAQSQLVILSKSEFQKMEDNANKLRSLDGRPRYPFKP